MTMKLDDIDKRILHDLQEDGRLTNVELSKRCNISAPPGLRRVRQIEEAGYIKSYHAVIDPQQMGYNVLILAQVSLKNQSDNDLRKFEGLVDTWPMVRECYLVSGGSDYFMKIYAKDWDDYQNFHTNVLSKVDLISQIRTSLVIRESKNVAGIPLEKPSNDDNAAVRSFRVVGSK